MSFLRRLLGVVVLLLSTAIFVGCIVVAIGVWTIRQGATSKADDLGGRIDTGLQKAAAGLGGIHRSVSIIRSDLKIVKDEPEDLEAGGNKNRLVAAFLRTLIQRLSSFSEAAAAISNLLRTYQELPVARHDTTDAERLARAADQSSEVSAAVGRLQEKLGNDKELSETEIVDTAAEADEALQKCDALVSDWQADLDGCRADLAIGRTRLFRWLTLAAVAITLLCVWMGISQISLFGHGWRWARGRARTGEAAVGPEPAN